MKFGLLVLFFLVCLVPTANGETLYVTDIFEVTLRTGPDITRKIIALPRSATAVEVLERKDDWTMVRLPNEKEGWIQSRYLIEGPPKAEVVETLTKENTNLKLEMKKLKSKYSELEKKSDEIAKNLGEATKAREDLSKDYETLRNESHDFLKLKAAYEGAKQDLAQKSQAAADLERELKDLRNNRSLRWFIAGASSILIGFIIGRASRRSKRRPSLL